MTYKARSIYLIDDDNNVNFLNKTIIRHSDFAEKVHEFQRAKDALSQLATAKATNDLPDIIFLDVNMPEMDGWRFMEEYEKIGIASPIVIMLTSSIDPKDKARASMVPHLKGFKSKPLSMGAVAELRSEFFSTN